MLSIGVCMCVLMCVCVNVCVCVRVCALSMCACAARVCLLQVRAFTSKE